MQREAIARWAEYRGVEIAAWHVDEDESGGTQDRPGPRAAIERIESGETKGIACWRLNRCAQCCGRDRRRAAHPGARRTPLAFVGGGHRPHRPVRVPVAKDEPDQDRRTPWIEPYYDQQQWQALMWGSIVALYGRYPKALEHLKEGWWEDAAHVETLCALAERLDKHVPSSLLARPDSFPGVITLEKRSWTSLWMISIDVIIPTCLNEF
ncbi:MAG: recombinase family protein [Solirubrobacteraceae bacterium]